MAVKHAFVSPKSDGGDATLVRPSNWNDDHDGTNDHDHTATSDGGVLTNDEHDGYIEIDETAEPGSPGANKLRLYTVDQNGHTVIEAKGPAGTTRRLARDNFIIAKVQEAGGISLGQVLYISGAAGSNEQVGLAKADSETTLPVFGFALESGANNAFIKVMFAGKIVGFDTASLIEGDRIYVSASTAGGITATKPSVPNFIQRVGIVTRAHASLGEVLVQITAVVDPSLIGTSLLNQVEFAGNLA